MLCSAPQASADHKLHTEALSLLSDIHPAQPHVTPRARSTSCKQSPRGDEAAITCQTGLKLKKQPVLKITLSSTAQEKLSRLSPHLQPRTALRVAPSSSPSPSPRRTARPMLGFASRCPRISQQQVRPAALPPIPKRHLTAPTSPLRHQTRTQSSPAPAPGPWGLETAAGLSTSCLQRLALRWGRAQL